MKFEKIKSILAVLLSMALGFIFEVIAPETGWRNLISFGVGTISVSLLLVPALGIMYSDTRRTVSIKVYAWIMAMILILANLIFACFEYMIDVYVAIILLLAILGILGVYTLSKTKPANK